MDYGKKMTGKELFDWTAHQVRLDCYRKKCNPEYDRAKMSEEAKLCEWETYNRIKTNK